MRSPSILKCVGPVTMLVLTCGFAQSSAAQAYTAEVLNRLVALPGIPATNYHHVASTGGAVGDGYGSATGGIPHAMYMPPGATTGIDLQPPGFLDTYGSQCAGSQQVGYGWSNGANQYHALRWDGSAASVVDLHPSGYSSSRAEATDGSQQGGFVGADTGGIRAAIWTGSASSIVHLHPDGYYSSRVVGIGDGQQVGYSTLPSAPLLFRAMAWTGTAESTVDLHPPGFNETFAFGVGGGQQVGYGKPPSGPSSTVALLWNGTAESVVDLHPAGFIGSVAYATNGQVQVGDGGPGAAAWRGSAESYINLHALLPAGGGWSNSRATSIDHDGVIYGRAHGRHDGVLGWYVIRWTPIDDCVAKYNDDGDPDILDFLDFIDDFSSCEGEPAPCGSFGDPDINGDTTIDILDFLDFIDSFGTGC